ncbi:hypothetical protein JM49_13620 [Pseudomonas chlororaphis subsp. aurantiaca]|nr:hypothetical protein JM49_13620 [Pseudomonas chlororaphis subsp. aurantiaca]
MVYDGAEALPGLGMDRHAWQRRAEAARLKAALDVAFEARRRQVSTKGGVDAGVQVLAGRVWISTEQRIHLPPSLWWAGRMNQGSVSVIIIQNPAPKLSYAELAKMIEQKRAVEQVNLLDAKLNPAFLAKLEAAIESADVQQGVQPVFPIEV